MGLLDLFKNGPPDAIELLKEDHEKFRRMFRDFEEAEGPAKKQRIVREVLEQLEVHMIIEEEIFYPAVRRSDNDEKHQAKMAEAIEEHHVAKLLMSELRNKTKASQESRDAKFQVLSESVKHHIEEEESDVLPKAKEEELDLAVLGRKMAQRKQRLSHHKAGGARSRHTTDPLRQRRAAKTSRMKKSTAHGKARVKSRG
jgi:hemerythrin-like domain-containing protein